MAALFEPLTLRSLQLANRIMISPMCQYSAVEGCATAWHYAHLLSLAGSGASLLCVEATAVTREARITPGCLGLWDDTCEAALAPVIRLVRTTSPIRLAMQLAHAGRKGSSRPPWEGGRLLPPGEGGWVPEAPSPIPHAPDEAPPRQLSADELPGLRDAFAQAARRAARLDFDALEVHMAHGYLLHEFLSPLSNQRHDEYGGSLENRARFPRQVAQAVRALWPEQLPVFVRISASDWIEGGWDLTQSIQLARWLKEDGIDLIDCSSAGLVANARVPAGPGYQTPFATAIREQAGIATVAVGLITEPVQAEHIVATSLADVVFMAREFLRDPYWPLRAARELGADVRWPDQYDRARPG